MKAYIFFDISFFLIEFEPFLGTDIREYQKKFDEWYYEEDYEIVNGKKIGTGCFRQRHDLPYKYFDLEPIFDWMREIDPNSNPRVLEEHVFGDKYDKNIPAMCF